MDAADWNRIHTEFEAWFKTVTLTRFGSSRYKLEHNSAWDNYFCGYKDGVDEGVNRALGITDEESRAIANFVLEAEVAGESRIREQYSNVPDGSAGQTREKGDTATDDRPGRLKALGAVVCAIGVFGAIGLMATASTRLQTLANVANLALLIAFGLATYQGRRAAIPLGWTYVALFSAMTVAHGFVPLEILQWVALIGFVLYLQRQRLGVNERHTKGSSVLIGTAVAVAIMAMLAFVVVDVSEMQTTRTSSLAKECHVLTMRHSPDNLVASLPLRLL